MGESGVFTETKNKLRRDGKIIYKDGREEILEYGITEISENAYSNNYDIASISLPSSVLKIGDFAFYGCEIEEFLIPWNLKEIGEGAFAHCEKLAEINIPASVDRIGKEAFYECAGLKSVKLGKGVCSIGKDAFGYCKSLKEIELTENISDITGNPFRGLRDMKITVSPKNTHYKITGECLLSSDGKELVAYLPQGKKNDFSIPEGVETICRNAFADTLINCVSIPESVTCIQERAFWLCKYLESVKIPGGVREISMYAFDYCKNLRSVEIGEGVEKIEKYAFCDCERLNSIVLPKSLQEVEEGAFDGCSMAAYTAEIFYGGTKGQWKKINIESYGNTFLEESKKHFKTVFGYTK